MRTLIQNLYSKRKLMLIQRVLVVCLFTWENKLLLQLVMIAPGRFGTLKMEKTSWLEKAIRIGFVVLISTHKGLIWLHQEVTSQSRFGTLSIQQLLIHLTMSIQCQFGKPSSMTQVILFYQEVEMVLLSSMIWMLSKSDSNTDLTLTL